MNRVPRSIFWGLGLIALCTLMLEVALTRIYSVIMWYHMSLVAVSMAMFGLTAGALVVHFRPGSFGAERASASCARHSLWFALSLAIGLPICLLTPFRVEASPLGLFLLAYWNAIVAVPFVFGGIVVCVALTRFPRSVGKLYAADLFGAALGCVGVVWLLNRIDAISSVLLIAGLAAAASAIFTLGTRDRRHLRMRAAVALLLGAGALINGAKPALRVVYSVDKPVWSWNLRHELWNVFAYVTVSTPRAGRFYWGPGRNARDLRADEYLDVRMDTRASTPLVRFNGIWRSVEYLLYDVTNLVHHLRDDGPVLVIGSGGGRDVLSALIPSRGKRQVTGIDINPAMVNLLTELESDYSGNIAQLPNVDLHVDEARNWMERSAERFQVIAVPLVDTSAASAAGAYALTENSLYTVEAFRVFRRHLADDGILSVSRWWHGGRIGESHRLVGLAAAALRADGVVEPRRHLVVARGSDIVTLLVSARPFVDSDLKRLRGAAERCGFELLLTPGTARESTLLDMIERREAVEAMAGGIVDLSPPTDDRPFFFHSFRLRGRIAGAQAARDGPGVASFDVRAMVVLFGLVGGVSLLALFAVALPFWLERRAGAGVPYTERAVGLAYFAMLGLGFMLFESSQIQRLSIVLGYPVYALTVVLFSLLLTTALGARLAGVAWNRLGARSVPYAASAVVVVLLAIGLLSRHLSQTAMEWTASRRIAVAIATMSLAGVFLGAMFPLGIRLVERRPKPALAWCWAINGIASTWAAVISIATSIFLGISFTFWLGVGCYALAVVLAASMARRRLGAHSTG